jgi:uncharacterized protein
MSRHLLDVNTVLALLDPMHVFHLAAHQWLHATPANSKLLTSPIVQNGALRVASQPKYSTPLGTVDDIRKVIQHFCNQARHEFCPDDISLLDNGLIADPKLLTPSRITDLYLLALARRHNARLATFDTRIPTGAILDGHGAIELIPA